MNNVVHHACMDPIFARHLGDAQASGLPGAYPNGTPLTRMVDAGLSNHNGALLNGFTGIYRTERMLDGDKFFARIVP